MNTGREIYTGLTAGFRQDNDEGAQHISLERRSFLGLALSTGAAAVSALLSVPLLRFVLYPLISTAAPLAWTEVGSTSEFASVASPVKKIISIEQRDGWRRIVSEKALYVCKDASGALCALSAVCPHLGCTVAWHDDKEHFKCPCHNGTFAAHGELLGGPPLRGMDKLECKIEEGRLKVRYQSFRQAIPRKEVVA